MYRIQGGRILLTGGTGLVGTPLTSLLINKGASVICLTRTKRMSVNTRLTYVQYDLTDQNWTRAQNVRKSIGTYDAIVYAAASIPPLRKGPESLLEAKSNNLDPFLRFLETFGPGVKKIVYTSSIDVNGNPKKPTFDESAAVAPVTNYAIAKYCSEQYLEYWCRIQNIPYSIVRFSQVYGPNEPLVRVLSFLVDAATHRKPFTLYGSGEEKRKFLYNKDAALGVYLALHKGNPTVYHICGKDAVSVKQAIALVRRITKFDLPIVKKSMSRVSVDILPKTTKAKKELGFVPQYTFGAGMREVLHTSTHAHHAS